MCSRKCARMTAEFRDMVAFLIGDANIVDARTASLRRLACFRRQAVAETARRDIGDGAVLGDDQLIVAVAGKREGAVCKRENIAAVAIAMTVGHGLRDFHGERGAAG